MPLLFATEVISKKQSLSFQHGIDCCQHLLFRHQTLKHQSFIVIDDDTNKETLIYIY